MRLEIGNFYVKDIVFGNELSYEDGILTIEKEAALNYIRQDERITEAELYIAKPGDQIRMCPVKEAIEPRVRPDGRSAFPGYTGDMTRAGEGVTYALKNCSVLAVSYTHLDVYKRQVLQIQASYNQFTKAEKKVASYVIENKKKVLYMSITDLADACQVGETSVYRFCRTINLQGYQEFKMKLSISLAAEGSIHKRKEEDGDQGLDNFAEQIMKLHTQAIHESYCLLDTSQFQKILQMMNDAKRIFFFGIGDSLLTAEEARNKFIRITNKVVCISDPVSYTHLETSR